MYSTDPSKCEPQLSYESGCGGFVCQWAVELPCAGDGGPVLDGGTTCTVLCDSAGVYDAGDDTYSCNLQPLNNGQGVVAQCFSDYSICIGGRSPRGFVPSEVHAASASGAHLARMAQLEAASVDAFHALQADLAHLGAPKRLLDAVRNAARDEIRHARIVGSLAARFGARVPPVTVPPAKARSLEEIAIENAREGCVREAFGVAIVALQATSATDPRVRRTMRTIARDELEHAVLAWDIAAWLEPRLDDRSRRRVRDARLQALRGLRAELHDELRGLAVLGLPDERTARTVLERMWTALASGDLSAAA
jgi:hypothetical protein